MAEPPNRRCTCARPTLACPSPGRVSVHNILTVVVFSAPFGLRNANT
jgi:hypothetical protein